jgi:hypothetical protein
MVTIAFAHEEGMKFHWKKSLENDIEIRNERENPFLLSLGAPSPPVSLFPG